MLQQCFRRELAMLAMCAVTATAGTGMAQSAPPKASFAPAPAAQPPPTAPAPPAPAAPAPAEAAPSVPEPVAPAPAASAPAPSSPDGTAPVEVPSLPPGAIPSSSVVAAAPPAPVPPSYAAAPALPACKTRSQPSPCVQPPNAYNHDGFYLRFSAGPHYASFTGNGKSTDVSVHGLTSATMLAIGGTPGDGFVLAGAFRAEQVRGTLHGAPKPEGNATATVGQLGLLMDWFPRPSDGWHAGGLAALGIVTISDSKLPDSSGAAFAASIFGGYDFWIGPEWSLGIMATFTATSRATLKDSKQNDSGYELNALAGGIDVSVAFH